MLPLLLPLFLKIRRPQRPPVPRPRFPPPQRTIRRKHGVRLLHGRRRRRRASNPPSHRSLHSEEEDTTRPRAEGLGMMKFFLPDDKPSLCLEV
ncbi:unnamed protein product [Ectocarpus sp. 13 AM-2016]